MTKHRILVLGGTTEARQLAELLAPRPEFDCIVSLAGRTLDPKPLPLPVRSGGFGGAAGLANYLRNENISLLIDATHPFANQISANAASAAAATDTPIFALCRPGWQRQPGDRWSSVASIEDAVRGLGNRRKRVFLAIGRQEAHQFSGAPQHDYLVRSVEPVDPPLAVPDCRYILASGPFAEQDERKLLADNAIDVIVSKNSGGTATYGKIAAARTLGIDVVMIERKPDIGVRTVHHADAALELIDHLLAPAMNRGV
ncbi:cobalt-precorrin-6A reductase [Rhizobium sp. KVB221]|uniref:Cobalt-precorrin-6A reductase n=1 Tax=Rhizobium setariae TaxID=2801340 RepID=A0A936YNP7_9HYPH|nr:cobalt-precorrin-6A reductase [Rhizobium setariae]MBL0373934.1 cobalt-precorrin-6A reductase [Rhizobium setariae]